MKMTLLLLAKNMTVSRWALVLARAPRGALGQPDGVALRRVARHARLAGVVAAARASRGPAVLGVAGAIRRAPVAVRVAERLQPDRLSSDGLLSVVQAVAVFICIGSRRDGVAFATGVASAIRPAVLGSEITREGFF